MDENLSAAVKEAFVRLHGECRRAPCAAIKQLCFCVCACVWRWQPALPPQLAISWQGALAWSESWSAELTCASLWRAPCAFQARA